MFQADSVIQKIASMRFFLTFRITNQTNDLELSTIKVDEMFVGTFASQ